MKTEQCIGKPLSCKKSFWCTVLILAVTLSGVAGNFVNGVRVDGAAPGEWTHDWDAATAAAKEKGMPVFVNFTGSDWCGWCMLLKRQVFSQPEWNVWASNNVYLVHVDFPNDKELVPEKYHERNKNLERRYRVRGYPTCYLLDSATLEPLGCFGASRDVTASAFIEEVAIAMPGAKKNQGASNEKAPPAADATRETDAGGVHGMPIGKFPVDGLVAGFTFNDEDRANDFVKKGRKFALQHVPSGRPQDLASLVTNGALRLNGVYSGENANITNLEVPELRYDRFSVAMNFQPDAEKGRMSPLVSFGGGLRWFHVLLRVDGTPVVLFRGLEKGELSFPLPEKIRSGEWNWIAVAFDIAEHRLSVVLNGQRLPDIALPADFAFRISREDRERSRSVQFANTNNGTVFKGEIKGFLLFDRAFTNEELDTLAVPCKPPAAPWKFSSDKEGAALYWNGTISDDATTLEARIADDAASVSFPDRLSMSDGVLDLCKPILDANGNTVPLVGVGRENDAPHVGFGGRLREVATVRLPASLRYIGPGAFERFVSLIRFNCPDSVRIIGSAAFDDCRNLRQFRLGRGVEDFSSDRVFMGCEKLEAIEVDPENRHFKTVDGVLFSADGKRLVAFPPGRNGQFSIPAGVEEIPPRAFLGCHGLTRISIPASVKKIGGHAFADCPALERIEFENRSFKLDDSVFGASRGGEQVHRPETNLLP